MMSQRSLNVSIFIDYIKENIERCIKSYLSLQQTVEYLHEYHQIDPFYTRTIWIRLRRENPSFFDEYYKRCVLTRQIAKFNELLAQQIDMMERLRENDDLSTAAPPFTDDPYQPHGHHHVQPNHYQVQLNNHYDQAQIYDQGIASHDLSYSMNSNFPLMDPSSFVTPTQSYLSTSDFGYDIGFNDPSSEHFATNFDMQQQSLPLQIQSHQPPLQHLMDQQQVYYHPQEHQVYYHPQEHQFATFLPQEQPQASNNLDFGDGFTNNNNISHQTYYL